MEEETKRLVLELLFAFFFIVENIFFYIIRKQVESLLPYSFNLFCSIQTEFWEQNTG